MIERQNILDLIGENKYKYTSCIITSFTFDFTFFEERVIPFLNHANIKNVNLFIDSKYINTYLEYTTGNEFKNQRAYGINPISSKGIFHPKIMLLSGSQHGLVIIGSGNLTSSGLNTNDEIWGAFHLNSLESKNAPIFADVWEYLEQFFSKANGFNLQKLNWIKQYSPWLNELKSIQSSSFNKLNDNTEIKFLRNSDTSIYHKLNNLLPKSSLKKITVISPFLDENAALLNQFKIDFKPKEFACITDPIYGLPPEKINSALNNYIRFYKWENCIKIFDTGFHRLHAKLFHFIFENGIEYLLIGSCNATIQAFGVSNKASINDEAGILLKRKSKGNFLNELGITFENAKPIDISTYKRSKTIQGDALKRLNYDFWVEHSEKNGTILLVTLRSEISYDCDLIVLTSDNEISEIFRCQKGMSVLNFRLKSPINAFKLHLENKNLRVSNYAIIHDAEAQANGNPDQKYHIISGIIESLKDNPESSKLIELLRKTDYNWIDDEINTINKLGTSLGKVIAAKQRKKNYNSITTDEFNDLKTKQSLAFLILNNSSSQIAGYFTLFSRGLIKNLKVQENQEEALANISANQQTGQGEIIDQVGNINDIAELELRAVTNHLDKVVEFYSNELDDLQKTNSLNRAPRRNITIKDLCNISIALDLLIIYYGKQYFLHETELTINFNKQLSAKIRKVEKHFELVRLPKRNIDNPSQVYYLIYSKYMKEVREAFNNIDPNLWVNNSEYRTTISIKNYISSGYYDSVRGEGLKYYLIELLGSFLINSNVVAGFRDYGYEIINEKSLSLRKSISENAIILCLNVKWQAKECHWRDILLLDIFHFLLPDDQFLTYMDTLPDSILNSYNRLSFKLSAFNENFEYMKSVIIPNYLKYRHYFSKLKTDPVKVFKWPIMDDLIYAKEIGFAKLISIGDNHLSLEKPGFKWQEDSELNIIRIGYPKSQIKMINI